MSEIIAGTYELIERIGSGGGGVVYLAQHLRLQKMVVLKVDKRKLGTSPEHLRREVDALKNLSHTYIPQVYDFFVEGENVYTVMDYIEGESLDKPLKRGERFTQAQVLGWAIQLLEAVAYLHSPTHGEPPHGIVHSDIKPANIMLKPDGNICLIDFNIALALGEAGVVGRSAGYASPEHYGLNFSTDFVNGVATDMQPDDEPTEVMSTGDNTVAMSPSEYVSSASQKSQGSYSYSGRRLVTPDTRSDIYSLGATLYHLLSGKKPAKNATDVEKLSTAEFNPGLVKIISRAMNPNPELRYQTAEEMLAAVRSLRSTDPRVRALGLANRLVCGTLTVALVLGAGLAFAGLNGQKTEQQALTLAEYSANAFDEGDAAGAIRLAEESLQKRHTATGQYAISRALGVYDLTDGFKGKCQLELAGEVQKLAKSAKGSFLAVMTTGQVTVFAMPDCRKVAELAADVSALSDMAFVDDDRLVYAGVDGIAAYDVAKGAMLWQGSRATAVAASADGSTVAAVYKDETKAYIYNMADGKLQKTVDFAGKKQRVMPNDVFIDPENNLLALSATGRRLAVSFADGSLWVYDLKNSANDLIVLENTDFTHFEGGFCGEQLAFAAAADGNAYFAVADTAKARLLGSFSGSWPYRTRADESGIYVTSKNLLIKLDANSGTQTELAYTQGDITDFVIGEKYIMVRLADGTVEFYDKNAKILQQLVLDQSCDAMSMAGDVALLASHNAPLVKAWQLKNYADYQLLSYPAAYQHSEARLSADENTVVLFAYNGFRLYDRTGKLLADVTIPNADEVYDQQFRRDWQTLESRLDVIYNDGTVRSYSTADGSLLAETQDTAPDGSGRQEFFTDNWQIVADVHGAPKVYDKASGKLLAELQADDYLAYAEQVGEQVVAQYVTAEGALYGVILDKNLQQLARLDGLCDVLPDGRLLFDDMRGNIRQNRIYSIDELLALAKEQGGDAIA